MLQVEQKVAIFVELKGKDISSAVQQISATFDKLHTYLPEYQVYARIVGKSLPNISNTPNIDILLKKLIEKNKKHEIKIADMYDHKSDKLTESKIKFHTT